MALTIAEQLAAYICRLDFKDIPAPIVALSKECLLDQLGCELIGSAQSWNKIVYDYVKGFEGRPDCTIVNYGTKALPQDAAMVNATFGQGAELDDGMAGGGNHAGSASVPVALALCEKSHLDGKSFLTAFNLGYDIAYHLTRGMVPGVNHRGFHPQSVITVFTAAGIAGKLLKLTPEQMTNALAVAGSHASGTTEYDQSGGEVKRLHTGIPVRSGMTSAELAKMGLTGPPTIFEGKRGILPVFCDKFDAKAITDGLGEDFGVTHVFYKKHPTVGGIQCPIDVMTEILKKHKLKAEEIERIDVGVNERILLHGGSIYEPHDTISAQFSMAFSLALRILKGSNDLGQYTDPTLWRDPAILALGKKVHPYALPGAEGDVRFSCNIKVTLAGGKAVEGYLPSPKGMPTNPLTREELEEKFRRLAGVVLPGAQIDKIIATVDSVEQVKDVADLAAMLVR